MPKAKAKARLGPPPPQTAKVSRLADDSSASITNNNGTDKAILDRIRKCLARANHPNTPEMEAQNAMRMASRLMQQFNVTQADLIEEKANTDDLASLGGHSTVSIVRSQDDGRRVTSHTWTHDLGAAMIRFFDCDYYTTGRQDSFDFTFYGIPTNTAGAAVTFEIAHNLILQWARRNEGKVAKNSYCLGIAIGLYRIAVEEKAKEKEDAEDAEAHSKQAAEGGEQKTYYFGYGPDDGGTTRLPSNSAENASESSETDDDADQDDSEFTSSIAVDDDDYDDSDDDEVLPTFAEAGERPIDLTMDLDDALREQGAIRPLNDHGERKDIIVIKDDDEASVIVIDDAETPEVIVIEDDADKPIVKKEEDLEPAKTEEMEPKMSIKAEVTDKNSSNAGIKTEDEDSKLDIKTEKREDEDTNLTPRR
jgi:hypothetical protein